MSWDRERGGKKKKKPLSLFYPLGACRRCRRRAARSCPFPPPQKKCCALCCGVALFVTIATYACARGMMIRKRASERGRKRAFSQTPHYSYLDAPFVRLATPYGQMLQRRRQFPSSLHPFRNFLFFKKILSLTECRSSIHPRF